MFLLVCVPLCVDMYVCFFCVTLFMKYELGLRFGFRELHVLVGRLSWITVITCVRGIFLAGLTKTKMQIYTKPSKLLQACLVL
jgi:hypothetical protein